jgi:hypothetical protein
MAASATSASPIDAAAAMKGTNGNTASIIDKRLLQRDNRRIIAALAVLVALITDVALMMPAISLTRGELVCGMVEHLHTDACYQLRPTSATATSIDEYVPLNAQVNLASPVDYSGDSEIEVGSVDAEVKEVDAEMESAADSEIEDEDDVILELCNTRSDVGRTVARNCGGLLDILPGDTLDALYRGNVETNVHLIEVTYYQQIIITVK